jgi:hypothetical protein
MSLIPPSPGSAHGELFALWGDIFARGRAVSAGTGAGADAAAGAEPENGALISTGDGRPDADVPASDANRSGVTEGSKRARAWTAAFEEPRGSTPSQTHGAQTSPLSIETATPLASTVITMGLTTLTDAEPSAANATAAASITPAACDVTRTDSIVIYLNGSTVDIAVRDASLSAEEALRSAFDTAHQLTGRRAALRQLLLNGTTLYLQRKE